MKLLPELSSKLIGAPRSGGRNGPSRGLRKPITQIALENEVLRRDNGSV